MYEYTVGIIDEGPTDVDIIKAVLKVSFPNDVFNFRQIFPSPKELSNQGSSEGFGWGGVYRVCRDLREKIAMLPDMYDFFIVHVDGDVAYKQYSSIGEQPLEEDLPCASELDPIQENGQKFRTVVEKWVDNISLPIVFCLPFMCTETWVGNWLYPSDWGNISENTPDEEIYHQLFLLGKPKNEKKHRLIRKHGNEMKKVTKNYREAASSLTQRAWEDVMQRYVQAYRFHADLKRTMNVDKK